MIQLLQRKDTYADFAKRARSLPEYIIHCRIQKRIPVIQKIIVILNHKNIRYYGCRFIHVSNSRCISSPSYGNDNDEADEIAREITEYFVERVKK